MKKPKAVVKRLKAMLTPSTDRQPRLTGDSFLIYFRPDVWRDERLCVGVALHANGCVYARLVDDEDLTPLDKFYTRDTRRNLAALLDTIANRLTHGDLEPPVNSIIYTDPEPASGNSPGDILDMLWDYGPGLLAGKKKQRYFGGESENTKTSRQVLARLAELDPDLASHLAHLDGGVLQIGEKRMAVVSSTAPDRTPEASALSAHCAAGYPPGLLLVVGADPPSQTGQPAPPTSTASTPTQRHARTTDEAARTLIDWIKH